MAVILVAVVLFAAFGLNRKDKTQYFTARAERGDIRAVVDATGTINAVTSVQVGSQVSGNIYRLHADFNSKVKRGQLIAEIEPSLFQGALLQAKADNENAKANVASAKANLEKVHKILLSLDENERTVRVLEESYSVAWRAGVPAFSLEMEKFQGRTIGSKSFGIGYAFKGPDPLSFGKVYQYRFDVSEMKRPIIEVVTGSGWDLVPVISKKKLWF